MTGRVSDPVSEIVHSMWEGRFSQIPVYSEQNEFAELVTTETIARWLSQQPKAEPIDMASLVSNVIRYTEDPEHFAFVSKNATILDALDCFDDFAHRGKYLDALMVTTNGDPNRMPEAILTQDDLPRLYQKLSR